MDLCIHDLALVTGGVLRLAAMPPRDGEFTPIDRIVLSAEAASPGDVYWCLNRDACDVDLAYLRGALGVVAAGPEIEPWAGRFSLRLSDPGAALTQLLDHFRDGIREPQFAGKTPDLLAGQESCVKASELKVLQLCAARATDIYPHTCERQAIRPREHRCRRQAA